MAAFGFRKPQDLPRVIPIFPLEGALLLPRTELPLNIFEPRYLNMIDDALSGDRLIGMIQPVHRGADKRKPELSGVGCVGRITTYSETDDGRYLITLTGVCRFRVRQELDIKTPYRQIDAQWDEFADDLHPPELDHDIDRPHLTDSLRRYIAANGFSADWSAVEEAPAEALVNALSTLCPFEPEEKQALLEAPDVHARCGTLITLFEIDATPDAGGSTSLQ
jgi:Lon protease-like protein